MRTGSKHGPGEESVFWSQQRHQIRNLEGNLIYKAGSVSLCYLMSTNLKINKNSQFFFLEEWGSPYESMASRAAWAQWGHHQASQPRLQLASRLVDGEWFVIFEYFFRLD